MNSAMPSGVGSDNWMSIAEAPAGAADSAWGSAADTSARRRMDGRFSTRASRVPSMSGSDSPAK